MAREKRKEKKGPSGEQPTKRSPKRLCIIDPLCLEDLEYWAMHAPKNASKALELMKYVLRDPLTGPGKPEPLKSLGPNIWSRRITGEQRLVYVVFDDRISFVMARFHYGT